MARSRSRQKTAPLWLFLLALMVVPVWVLAMHWYTNSHSGWNRIANLYGQSLQGLPFAESGVVVHVVQPNGRRVTFARENSGGAARRGMMKVGYDDQAFWIRSAFHGWLGGPSKSIYVPWSDVSGCDGLRLGFRYLDLSLIVQEQGLLDTCENQTG